MGYVDRVTEYKLPIIATMAHFLNTVFELHL